MRIDERRRHQPAARIDNLCGLSRYARLKRDDPPGLTGDIYPHPQVGQAGIPDEEIEGHGRRTGPCWFADKA